MERVAILGATGTVGQKFITLLRDHPWFEIAELVAGPRSAGKRYTDACAWKQDQPIPASVADMVVKSTDEALDSRILFSGLDSSVAGEAESAYAAAGHLVISNSRNHRMDPDVPLVIPEVNPDHFALIKTQSTKGAIITNSNCSTMFMAMVLAPLHKAFGVKTVHVTTMQAVSGAGYPGVASMDILGNVVPFISGEEEKMETEAQKILGRLSGNRIEAAQFAVSAHCNRVPVFDGHTETLTITFDRKPTPEQVTQVLREFRGMPQEHALPSAPEQPIVVLDGVDQPQPARHVWYNRGMSTLVGRIRADSIGHIRMVILGHNTVRGAAGAAILNAEALVALGYLND